jgi:hypothetical protein
VTVWFTGSSVAGIAFVAATYTLSVLLPSGGQVHAPPKASAIGNIGVSLWLGASPLSV